MSEQTREAPKVGDVCWLEIPATNMARCQEFYKTIFQWEFAAPPAMKIPAGCYSIFSKPGTKLAGGVYLVKEEDMIQPKVNSEGRGQGAPRIAMVVEEVTGALKSIEAAGGKIVVEKSQIGSDSSMGYTGQFRDTEGNINGVWSMN